MLCLLGKLSCYFSSSQWAVLCHIYFLCHPRTPVWQSSPGGVLTQTTCTHAAYTHTCAHIRRCALTRLRLGTHSRTHTLTLLLKNASRRYRCMRISELLPDLLWELEVAQTWLMATHSKRNVRTERNDPQARDGLREEGGKLLKLAFLPCRFAAQPGGSKPGSVLCTRKCVLSGNLNHLRRGWSSCWHCWRV